MCAILILSWGLINHNDIHDSNNIHDSFPVLVPSSYPNGISGSRLHEASINISWSNVPVTEAGGVVTKYTVRYSKGAESCGYTYDRVVRTVSSDDSDLMISGLAVSSNYCVSVSVSNMLGDSPFSPYVLVPGTYM